MRTQTPLMSYKHIGNIATDAIVHFGTLPYYRNFHFNTLKAVEQIAVHQSRNDDYRHILRAILRFRENKLAELQFISIACAVLAGAIIGCIQWQATVTAYWLAPALWYSSLVFSVLGILLAAQQIAVFSFLGTIQSAENTKKARAVLERYLPLLIIKQDLSSRDAPLKPSPLRISHQDFSKLHWRPRWRMVFIWQCPIMFMSYSVCSFFLGLTFLVITPLIRLRESQWDSSANVAIFYLVVAAIACIAFVYCSYWIYRDVDMDTDTFDDEEDYDTFQPEDVAVMAKFLRVHELAEIRRREPAHGADQASIAQTRTDSMLQPSSTMREDHNLNHR